MSIADTFPVSGFVIHPNTPAFPAATPPALGIGISVEFTDSIAAGEPAYAGKRRSFLALPESIFALSSAVIFAFFKISKVILRR